MRLMKRRSGSTCTLAVPIYSALEHTENLRLICRERFSNRFSTEALIFRKPESCDRLQVGPHHVCNSADFRVFREIVDFALAVTTTFAQGFNRHI